METVYLHLERHLPATVLAALKRELGAVPFVRRVELHPAMPLDVLVEFETGHDVPMQLLERLGRHGLRSEVMYR